MERAKFGPIGNLGLLLGLIFGGVGIALMYGDKALGADMVRSWTWAWGVFIALTLGCLGMTLLSHVTRGAWSQSVLRIFEAGGGTKALLVMGILFLPIAANFGVPYFKWFPLQTHDEYMVTKAQWLNPTGFAIRFCVYFLLWLFLAGRLRKSSLRQDETRDIKEQHFRTNLASPGMVFFILSVTLAATDWFMSMDPHWFSTMYGPLYIIVAANMALALATVFVCINAKKEPYNQIISEDLTRDLGNLNFMLTMLWIYFSLSQFIIIWSGNLPEFASFYYKRQVESQFLLIMGATNVVFGWLVPWTALLAPRTKKNLTLLAWTAGAIFFMRFIDLYWTIMPFMRGGLVLPTWTDLLAVLGIGSFWLWAFGRTTTEADLLPAHDTRLQEALHHEHA